MVILNYQFFHVVDKLFFNPRGELKLPTFPHGRQKKNIFVNFTRFFLNIMTYFQKKIDILITLIDYIFRNGIEMST